ncbi:MAG: BamA/TamA family outer membrane protein, partial [Chitinophagaceae bacterium]
MRILLFVCLLCVGLSVHAQQKSDTLDLNEAIKQIMGSKDPEKQGRGISILPAIGYNPTFGLMLGATLTGGQTLGNPATTRLSTGTFTGFFTTKGIINVQLRHNVFTENNTWNFQGNAQITKMVLLDYGLGTNAGEGFREGMSINQYTLDNNEAVYPIKFNYIRIFEKVYKKISKTLMVGAGVAVDNHFSINDTELQVDSGKLTPHYNYSIDNGFNPKKYWTNGFMLNIQYNTREHPNRPHSGLYADVAFRINPKFLGSTRSSTQMMTEFRKYISLSSRNPEHVIAFWHLGTYSLGGVLPYLDLPGTGTDMYNRSGRAYT